ncbi:MAG: tetratricopeptide repeat protein [Alphaproteobacteria bacterium]|nr:tetratricopeptide repeat protein [Alphaproteobacteria bacterium]
MTGSAAAEAPQAVLRRALPAALAAHGRGALDEAWRLLDEAARVAPRHPDMLHLRGLVALGRGDAADGVAWIERAVAASAGTALYRNNLGVARRASGDLPGAIAAHREAIALKPDYAAAHNNLGAVLAACEEFADAANAFARAAALDPRLVDAVANEALARVQCDEAAAALGLVEDALARRGPTSRMRLAQGAALTALGRHDEAATALDDAVTMAPDDPEAWHNLGYVFQRLGQNEAACLAFDRALALDPLRRSTHSSRGLVRLSMGDFERGWRDYRRRRKGPGAPGDVPPTPLPHDLRARTITIARDQGVGDDLFFLRFAPELVRRGAALRLDVEPRLLPMLARAGFAVGRGGETILSGDLPFRLDHREDAACPPSLRLAPLDAKVREQAQLLAGAGPKPWIALSWRAGVRRQKKLAPPEALARALSGLPGTVVIVQRGLLPGERAEFEAVLGRRVVDASAANEDLEAMLALMLVADIHVAVSNTNLHLRAAVGRRTHVLLPFPSEWRWRAGTHGEPVWFRDHRCYRQDADGDWNAAFAALRGDLALLAPGM